MVDIVVCDSPVFALILGYGFVLVVAGLRIQRDNVPGMDEAGNVAKDAEEDVDERVGRAYSTLDPDFKHVRQDLERAFRGDRYVPAIGGNKIARSPRKISLEHILSAVYKFVGAKFLRR